MVLFWLTAGLTYAEELGTHSYNYESMLSVECGRLIAQWLAGLILLAGKKKLVSMQALYQTYFIYNNVISRYDSCPAGKVTISMYRCLKFCSRIITVDKHVTGGQ